MSRVDLDDPANVDRILAAMDAFLEKRTIGGVMQVRKPFALHYLRHSSNKAFSLNKTIDTRTSTAEPSLQPRLLARVERFRQMLLLNSSP